MMRPKADEEGKQVDAILLPTKGRNLLAAAVAGLSALNWETAGVSKAWTVKDYYIILTRNEEVTIEAILSVQAEATTERLAGMIAEMKAAGADLEQELVDYYHNSDLAEVQSDYAAAYQRAISLVALLDTQRLNTPGLLPWCDSVCSLADFLIHFNYGRKREYAALIANFTAGFRL